MPVKVQLTEPKTPFYVYSITSKLNDSVQGSVNYYTTAAEAVEAYGEAIKAEAQKKDGRPDALILTRSQATVLSAKLSFNDIAKLCFAGNRALEQSFTDAVDKKGLTLAGYVMNTRATKNKYVPKGDHTDVHGILYDSTISPLRNVETALQNHERDINGMPNFVGDSMTKDFYVSAIYVPLEGETVKEFPIPEQQEWRTVVGEALKVTHKIR